MKGSPSSRIRDVKVEAIVLNVVNFCRNLAITGGMSVKCNAVRVREAIENVEGWCLIGKKRMEGLQGVNEVFLQAEVCEVRMT